MNLTELAALYTVAGVGAAGAWIALRRREARPIDLALLLALWPLYGPFLWLTRPEAPAPSAPSTEPEPEPPPPAPTGAFAAAIRSARATPLAELLPDDVTLARLEVRLQTATRKRDEIDHLLLQPDFSEDDALRRVEDLQRRSGEGPQALVASGAAPLGSAVSRLHNIRRLRQLRDHFARELEQLHDLLVQLRIQAEVVRIAGDLDDESRHVLLDIVSRLEGLDAVLDDAPPEQGGAQEPSSLHSTSPLR